jgi:hypothetical protein
MIMMSDDMDRFRVVKRKYVSVRMPQTAYDNFVNRKKRMENVVMKITNRNLKIPLTRVFEVSSRTPINLEDAELFAIAKKRKGR